MTKDKQRELIDEILDNMTQAEFIAEFVKFFGAQRAATLVGWAVLWGVQGIENGSDYRAKLEGQGLSRSTAFRASADFRRFREHLEDRYSMAVPYDSIFRKLGKLAA